MKKKDVLYFKERLLAQKRQILQSVQKIKAEDLNVSRDDLATANLTQSLTLRLKGREQQVLPKIDKALARIEKGEYGVCEDCGGEIGMNRLEVRPFATLCIKCKEEQEHNEKMFANS